MVGPCYPVKPSPRAPRRRQIEHPRKRNSAQAHDRAAGARARSIKLLTDSYHHL
jgi:hypothetical protein